MKVVAVFGSKKIMILASTTTTTITTTIMYKMLAKEVVIEDGHCLKSIFFDILSKALVGLADDPQIQKMCRRRKRNTYLDDDLRNARTEFTCSQPTAPITQQPKKQAS